MKKSVFANIAVAPWKADERVSFLSKSPWWISTPCARRAFAAGLVGFRVMPRTFQSGRARKVCATDDPWFV